MACSALGSEPTVRNGFSTFVRPGARDYQPWNSGPRPPGRSCRDWLNPSDEVDSLRRETRQGAWALEQVNRDRERFGNRLLAGLLVDLPDAVIVLDPQGRLQWGKPRSRATVRSVAPRVDRTAGTRARPP